MKTWKEPQLRFLQAQTDIKTIMLTAIDLIQQLGFDCLAFSTHTIRFHSYPQFIAMSNFPAAWVKRYREMNYVKVDPTVAHCRRSTAPLRWTDELFLRTPAYRKDAYAHGICHGLSQSVHDYRGNLSVIAVTRRHSPASTDEFHGKSGQLLWLCNTLHALLSDPLLRYADNNYAPLSDREIEVLRWSARGKTAAEVSQILAVTPRTVSYHVNSVIKKLNVSNKTSAVMLAAMDGVV
jgi:LuxR family transcriptional regulator